MKLQITHKTEYSYTKSVFFEPHYLRFKPKNTPHSSIHSFKLEINPKPSGISEQIDIENNHIQLCWFEGTHHKLEISVQTSLDVAEFNPFDFLVYPNDYLSVPFEYQKQTKQLLKPSLQADSFPGPMKDFLNSVLQESNNQSLDFLTNLTKLIHTEFVLETREFGEPFSPDKTFNRKKGSCRDLSWMQINILRHLGIAARFVSGYFYLDSDNPEFELHAWVEAFLPGAGWIGFDPSHGILTGHFHVPLASSAFFENTMPVSGSIRGAAMASMENELKIMLI